MSLTTDPDDPRLARGVDTEPTDQAEVYLVLSEEERAKGFVRPVRTAYRHTGVRPTHPTRDLTPEQQARFPDAGYVAFEVYPESETAVGRFWTREQLESGCGAVTTMGQALSETYARDPGFYGATYCTTCRKHLPVQEFRWEPDGSVVGS